MPRQFCCYEFTSSLSIVYIYLWCPCLVEILGPSTTVKENTVHNSNMGLYGNFPLYKLTSACSPNTLQSSYLSGFLDKGQTKISNSFWSTRVSLPVVNWLPILKHLHDEVWIKETCFFEIVSNTNLPCLQRKPPAILDCLVATPHRISRRSQFQNGGSTCVMRSRFLLCSWPCWSLEECYERRV